MCGGGSQIVLAQDAAEAIALPTMLGAQLQVDPRFAPKRAARNVGKECGAAPVQRRRGQPLSAASHNGASVGPLGRIGPAALQRQRTNADDWRAQ